MSEDGMFFEGLPSAPGDIIMTDVEARITRLVMEQIVAGNDVSGYAEEAQVILNGLSKQIKEVPDEATHPSF